MFDDVGEEVAGRGEIFAKRRHLSEEARPPHCLKDFHSLEASQLKFRSRARFECVIPVKVIETG